MFVSNNIDIVVQIGEFGMKSVFKTIICFASVASLVFGLGACKKDSDDTTQVSRYSYTPSAAFDEEEETKEDATASFDELQKEFTKDDSWKKNYRVTYEYFNAEQAQGTVRILEQRTENAFTAEYLDTGAVLYYKANGNDTDYYVITPETDRQVHSLLKGKKFRTLSSMFMKLSNVDSNLPKQSNVLYMYDEIVAGRNCHKYIQRAYANAALTQSVYVWIDAEYGFAAKCEAYDAADNLTANWVIEEFETGEVKDADVIPDISAYEFTDEVG